MFNTGRLINQEIECELPRTGQVSLMLSLSPLTSDTPGRGGATIVIEDVTEARRLAAEQERERRRYNELLRRVIPIGVTLSTEKDFDKLLERIVVEAMALCDAAGGRFTCARRMTG